MKMQVSSFDVFDTVLTRAVGSPEVVFLLLGKRLSSKSLIEYTPEAFARARSQAEYRAHINVGANYSLRQIYTELATALRLSEQQRDKLINLECALEAELLRSVPGAKERVQTERKQGKRVVFTSNMYLPAEFILEQLTRHEFWVEGDALYVSCEENKSKRTGELYRELLRREGVSPAQVTHWGDNLRSDVRADKQVGLQIEHFQPGNPNRYEQTLSSYDWATEGLSGAMAGASRLARLSTPASSRQEDALRDVAAGVVAPTLVGYVLWTLQRANQLGLKRLYFVARDGQILLEIARRLVDKLNIDCELRYLHASRVSWYLPAVMGNDEQQASRMLNRPNWIWDRTDFLSVENLLARVGICPEEIRDRLVTLGFPEKDWSRNLTCEELQTLHPLLEEPQVRELIFHKAAQKRQVLMKYLEQEGLLDSTPKGMVDLSWLGSTLDSLATLLNTSQEAGVLPVGLYYGLRSGSQHHQGTKEGYFFDERFSTGLKGFLPQRGIVPVEMFCTGDHGTVVSFTDEGEQVQPVFSEECNQRVIEWGLPLVRQTVYAFTENLLLDESLVNPWADVREASAQVLKSFWLNPSYWEAKAWGDFPWEDGHGEDGGWLRLANSYDWRHVPQSLIRAKIPRHNRACWVEGSLARSSPAIQTALKSSLRSKPLRSGVKRAVLKLSKKSV
ncbi:MAG: hypothetical protein BRC55_06635 [Cyanobacteria bacterium SW_8_48_13]|nr:MAG: hypothetical protein BRC55_06635 [Cyanobacteria bacterium SW_8_48_13]